MKAERAYREGLAARGLGGAEIEDAVRRLRELEVSLAARALSLDLPEAGPLEAWIAEQREDGAAVASILGDLARYYAASGEKALAIRLLAYLSPMGVLPAMAGRLEAMHGRELRERIMARVAVPAPGAPPEVYPPAAAAFAEALREALGAESAARVLAWNVHGVPVSAFAGERERFLALGSVEAWLADYHRRQVAVLARHAESGELWFEQRVTQAVVDFVAGRQDVLSGIRDGDRVLFTKIPYDPSAWLTEQDPLRRRRLACHCPLAASSIAAGGAGVPSLWCACSAGFVKFRFDVVFGEETEAVVLDSVLAGEELCRFAVTIPARLRR